jgi:DNA polymerase-3 subunit delta
MPMVMPAALRTQVEAGATGPLYVLVGQDEAGKAAVAAEFLGLVDEGLHAFNVDRFRGGEIQPDDLIQASATLPMMAIRRVVLVHEAERLLAPAKADSPAVQAGLERLEAFITAPPAHATVVLVCGAAPDQRRRVVKLLFKVAAVIDCGTIADAAGAARWVKARAEDLGARLEPAAVGELVTRAGLDASRLRAALDRVLLYALGRTTVTAADVRDAVPAGPEAQVNFGVADAIRRDDVAEALRQLRLALDAGVAPVMMNGQLRAAAERLDRARLPAAIDAVLRTDLALKSSGVDPQVLLERLVLELTRPQRARRA